MIGFHRFDDFLQVVAGDDVLVVVLRGLMGQLGGQFHFEIGESFKVKGFAEPGHR
ncbi:hypothetical protein D3C81_1637180 [compost metagenome]